MPHVVLLPESDEDQPPVVDDRRSRKLKAQKHRACAGDRRSSRIAMQGGGEYVSVPDKAAKRRDLLDALVGCSPKLRAKAVKNQVVDAIRKPMGVKFVSELRASAGTPSSPVTAGVDV
jgi:hypothetical protein